MSYNCIDEEMARELGITNECEKDSELLKQLETKLNELEERRKELLKSTDINEEEEKEIIKRQLLRLKEIRHE